MALETYASTFVESSFKATNILGDGLFITIILIALTLFMLSRKPIVWAELLLPVSTIYITFGGLVSDATTASAVVLLGAATYTLTVLRQPLGKAINVVNKELSKGLETTQATRQQRKTFVKDTAFKQSIGDSEALKLNLAELQKSIAKPTVKEVFKQGKKAFKAEKDFRSLEELRKARTKPFKDKTITSMIGGDIHKKVTPQTFNINKFLKEEELKAKKKRQRILDALNR